MTLVVACGGDPESSAAGIGTPDTGITTPAQDGSAGEFPADAGVAQPDASSTVDAGAQDAAVTDATSPMNPYAPTPSNTMALGIASTCARTATKQIKCWGSATAGGIGLPMFASCTGTCGPLTATTLPGVVDATGLATGYFNRSLYYRTASGEAFRYAATPVLLASGVVDISTSVDPHVITVATTTQVLEVTPSGGVAATISSPSLSFPLQLGDGQRTCAVARAGGTPACWGRDRIVTQIAALRSVTQVESGTTTACALVVGGRVSCWGGAYGASPVEVGGLARAVQIALPPAFDASDIGACAVTAAGTVTCWKPSAAPAASALPGVTGAVEVKLGDRYACARTNADAIFCWGDNTYGQLGTGATGNPVTTPVRVVGF